MNDPLIKRRSKSVPEFAVFQTVPATSIDAHTEAMKTVGTGLHRIADEMAAARTQRKDMDEFFRDANEFMSCSRRWLKKWGPWMLASIPAVVTFINAVSPNAARVVAELLHTLPSMPQ